MIVQNRTVEFIEKVNGILPEFEGWIPVNDSIDSKVDNNDWCNDAKGVHDYYFGVTEAASVIVEILRMCCNEGPVNQDKDVEDTLQNEGPSRTCHDQFASDDTEEWVGVSGRYPLQWTAEMA